MFESGEMERFLLPRARALARAYGKRIPARTRVGDPDEAERLLQQLESLTGDNLFLMKDDDNGEYHLFNSREVCPDYSCYLFPVGGTRSLRDEAERLLVPFLSLFFKHQYIDSLRDLDYILDNCSERFSDNDYSTDERLDCLRTIDLCEDYMHGERAKILSLPGDLDRDALKRFVPKDDTEKKMLGLITEGLSLIESDSFVLGHAASMLDWYNDAIGVDLSNAVYLEYAIRYTVDLYDAVSEWTTDDMESYYYGGVEPEPILVCGEVTPSSARNLSGDEETLLGLLAYYDRLVDFLSSLPVCLPEPPESEASKTLKRITPLTPCPIPTSENKSTSAGLPAQR